MVSWQVANLRRRLFVAKVKNLKRKGNLYAEICSRENLELADKKAREGKSKQYGVKLFDRNREANFVKLQNMLLEKKYVTSLYKTFFIYEPKEREIFSLPYFPDRILHHAIMNVIKRILLPTFTADTYSCIEGRGILGASFALRDMLKDKEGTKYCLKIDITKFYGSVDHETMKMLLRRKFKDWDLMNMTNEIIDSAPGLPIGNLCSQYFSNFYLSPLDHFVKEKLKVQKYLRYLDDMVFLSGSKEYLHLILAEIRIYLREKLKLEIKDNYQIFPVGARPIDVVGYVHGHDFTYLRKTIKQDFARMLKTRRSVQSIGGYIGWLKYGDCNHLRKKLLCETV